MTNDSSEGGDDPTTAHQYWYSIQTSDSGITTIEPTDSVVYIRFVDRGGEQSDPLDAPAHWTPITGPTEDEKLYGYLKIENIEHPQYNTIYKIVDKDGNNPLYVIYYIDQGWYQIIFEDDSFSIGLAKIPIYGMVNYRGTVLKRSYSAE